MFDIRDDTYAYVRRSDVIHFNLIRMKNDSLYYHIRHFVHVNEQRFKELLQNTVIRRVNGVNVRSCLCTKGLPCPCPAFLTTGYCKCGVYEHLPSNRLILVSTKNCPACEQLRRHLTFARVYFEIGFDGELRYWNILQKYGVVRRDPDWGIIIDFPQLFVKDRNGIRLAYVGYEPENMWVYVNDAIKGADFRKEFEKRLEEEMYDSRTTVNQYERT